MQRLLKYNQVALSTVASKSSLFSCKKFNLTLRLVAGLYKPASVKLEHGLIVSSLAGMLATARPQLHGKRQKRTVSLTVSPAPAGAWSAIDKLVSELLPRIGDFRTPKFRRPENNNYSLRLRQKFTPLVDFEDLVSSEMFDSHRGIFLPLTAHFYLGGPVPGQVAETYLRILRLPFTFYARRPAPAFDDLATFQQSF